MKEREIERILKALANKRRLSIVTLLYVEKEQSVGEIARSIKLSFKSTSRHLSSLINAEVVDKEQRGTQVFYSLNSKAPEIAKRFLRVVLT
jgi:DNA-binding transcriptional ArsR family regulator